MAISDIPITNKAPMPGNLPPAYQAQWDTLAPQIEAEVRRNAQARGMGSSGEADVEVAQALTQLGTNLGSQAAAAQQAQTQQTQSENATSKLADKQNNAMIKAQAIKGITEAGGAIAGKELMPFAKTGIKSAYNGISNLLGKSAPWSSPATDAAPSAASGIASLGGGGGIPSVGTSAVDLNLAGFGANGAAGAPGFVNGAAPALTAAPSAVSAAAPAFGELNLPGTVGGAAGEALAGAGAGYMGNKLASKAFGSGVRGDVGGGVGGALGGIAGLFGGPLAPLTVPLGAGIGSFLGHGLGQARVGSFLNQNIAQPVSHFGNEIGNWAKHAFHF